MIPESKDPNERAIAIKKLEERWLLKLKQRESSPVVVVTSKKTRTSLTNPITKGSSFNRENTKEQSS